MLAGLFLCFFQKCLTLYPIGYIIISVRKGGENNGLVRKKAVDHSRRHYDCTNNNNDPD